MNCMSTSIDRFQCPWNISEQDFPPASDEHNKSVFFLRHAILAPSSHNTQPWKFAVREGQIDVLIDTSRWLRVADADQRELHISVGCAIENLIVAAAHFGHTCSVSYFPLGDRQDLAATITVNPKGQTKGPKVSELYGAIARRKTSHRPFSDRPVAEEDKVRLTARCDEDGLSLHLLEDSRRRHRLSDLTMQADRKQFADSAWRRELGYWLGQGVFGTSWLKSKMAKLVVTHANLGKSIAKHDSRLLISAPVFAVITSHDDSRALQVRAGRAFERIALAATVMDISVHPMSQILELPELKQELAELLPDGASVPQHAFRLGYAAADESHTPRRSLDEVLVRTATSS
jgi:nitroreductase